MLADYSATIRRLFQGLLCDYPATISPLVLLSGTGSRRFSDTGDSGRLGSGSCCKTPRKRPTAARPVWRALGVSIPGICDALRIPYICAVNAPYSRFVCLGILVYYHGEKTPYTRENGAILRGCGNAREVIQDRTHKKPPRNAKPSRGAPEQPGKRKTPERVRGCVICCFSLRLSVSAAA